MYGDVDRILYSREVIEERVKELAGQVVGAYRDRPFMAAVTLNGAFMFAADLVRHLPQKIDMVFVQGSQPEIAVHCKSKGETLHVLGMPRVNLYLVAERIKDGGEALAWPLPYEIVIVGVFEE